MNRNIAKKFNKRAICLSSSWAFIREDIAKEFEQLQQTGNLTLAGGHHVIWKTRNKFVLKTPLTDNLNVAYKTFLKIKSPLSYVFRNSPCTREALNYQLLSDLDIPLPRLVAVGEIRKFFYLKNAFMCCEFAEGFSNGRNFINIDSDDQEMLALREEFLTRNIKLLAHCHDHNIFHGGFTPANLLYKRLEQPDQQGNKLAIKWIDIATCTRLPRWVLQKKIAFDLEHLLGYFRFPPQQIAHWVNIYIQSSEKPVPPPEKLLREITELQSKRHHKSHV